MKRKTIMFIVCMMLFSCFSVITKADNTYSVVNAKTGTVYATYTTYANALSNYNSRKSSDTSTSYGIMLNSKLITCDNAVARFSGYYTCTETDTGRSNYCSGSSATDAAYLGTSSDGTKVYIMISGQRLTVSVDNLLTLEESSQTSVKSYYTNNGGYMKHYIYSYSSSPTAEACVVGYSYSKFTDGVKYYSYDGHYFYTDYNTMLSDYRNKVYTHSINPSEPYYNYYQYLSHRTSTAISATQINNYIVKNIGSSSNSVMYNSGSAFINAGTKYTVNPTLILGVAILESGWGRSNYALNNNNLFGHGAYDNTTSATSYSSVQEGLEYHAYNYISAGYLDPTDSRYRGPQLGNKQSGVNVCYASTAYWGEQIAQFSYTLDNFAGKIDYGRYTIGVTNGNVSVYNSPSTDSTLLYKTGDYNGVAVNNSSIVILGTETNGGVTYYKIASDSPLNDSRTKINPDGIYDSSRDYAYMKASDVTVVFNGSGNISSSSSSSYTPNGTVDAVTSSAAGQVYVAGWAFDKDDISKNLDIKVYVGTTLLGTLSANQTRDDVNTAYGITGKHGYSGTVSTTLSGTQVITIKAVDPQTNVEYTIGSKSVTITASSTSGSTYTTNYNPTGCVDGVSASVGQVSVRGWAFDKDSSSSSIDVKVYIGSTCLGTLTADQIRDDVDTVYGITGNHGYSGTLSTTLTGEQTVTIKAVNVGSGEEYTIGSKTVTIPGSTVTYTTKYNPVGCVDGASASEGSVSVWGWAFDKDSEATSIGVKVYIGSTCLGTISADQTRDDVNTAYGISGSHGFKGTLSTTLTGTQTLTIKAVNVGSGVEYTIGTKSVTIPSSTTTTYTTNYNPTGCVDSVSAKAGKVTVGGWAFDKDSSSTSIDVKVYIGSTCLGTLTANSTRDDVNKAYGITGTHGYSGTLSTTLTGTQTVTIKAVNVGSGVEYTIGTKSVTIPSSETSTYTTSYNPTGCVDSASATAGSVKVSGWAFDKDSSSTSIDVKVYIGSTCLGTLNANQTRDDVNKAYGITGTHGFSGTLSTTLTGTQTVTIKAVNVGSGAEYTIGTKTVTIPSTTYTTKYAPTGSADVIQAQGSGQIYAGGWVFDKDSASTNLTIKMYAGSTLIGSGTTSFTRSDVNSAYGITGTHGYNLTCTTTLRGTYTVTIKAVDLQTNTEYTIGSKSITIS